MTKGSECMHTSLFKVISNWKQPTCLSTGEWNYCIGFPDSSFGKESTCNAGDHGSILGSGSSPGEGIGYPLQYFGAWPGFEPWVRKIPWRRERLPTPVFWPGEFHGVCSPWGCKESDTTEWLSLSRGYKCIKHTWNWAISTPTSTHKLEVYFCIYGNLNTCLLCCDE